MKPFILVLVLICTNLSFAQTISGEVSVQGAIPKGVLYIFAKRFDGKMPMPLAVKRIRNPKFPVKFELSQKDAMLKHIPFKGPFVVTARLSPSGNVSDKGGVEVSTIDKVEVGQGDIKLVLVK